MNISRYVFEGSGQATLTPVLTSSGSFVMGNEPIILNNSDQKWPAGAYSQNIYEICNPMVVQQPEYTILASAPEQFAYDLKSSFRDAEIITPAALQGYAERLTDVAMQLAKQSIDLMIVPYRGGLTPSLHLQVMNKFSYPTVPLGFSRGSQEIYWDEIADELLLDWKSLGNETHCA